VGIVGYGHIGREVARLAKGHSMRVLAMKKHPARLRSEGYQIEGVGDADGSLPDAVYGPGDLKRICEESDIVVSTLPLTDETSQAFGDSQFDAMKRSAFFINVSRGGVVDHDALVRALQRNSIAGACLDVMFTDPKPLPPDHPLWEMDNVFITPHISGNRNDEYMQRSNDLFTQNLNLYLERQPLLNTVTREKGY
jgi:phosphoglycerate dehydrogenase-like enzyme